MSCLRNRRIQRQAARAPAYYPLVPGYGAAPPAGPYYPAPGPYYGGNPEMMMRPVQGLGGAPGMYPDQQYQNLQAEEHRHKKNEHRAEMGALGTGAFAAVSLSSLLLICNSSSHREKVRKTSRESGSCACSETSHGSTSC
ncbi:hypothetical protein BDL97_01G048700 [Sphagnum fallax]|nr:hypothetical protein BDL97_01G048700 [Sphagnum fallax]